MHKEISELRQRGLRVYVYHDRIIKNTWVLFNPSTKILVPLISPKGGSTVVELHSKNGQQYTGLAICNKKDCYNKKIGLAIALERAIKEMNSDPA